MEDVRKASDELLGTLRRANELLEKLLEFSVNKEAVLKSDDIGALNELLVKEEDILAAFKENEDERKRIAQTLAAAGAPGMPMKLRDIAASAVNPPDREKIEGLRTALTEKLGQLMHQNDKVGELLQYKVNYTNFMINVLCVPESNLLSYNGQGGRENKTGGLNLFDCRA